jgi:general secretion pathway protein D
MTKHFDFKIKSSAVAVLALILVWIQPFSLHAQTGETLPEDQYVSIDFNDVDLSVFIKFIAELTGKNFIIDQRVRGKVNIHSPSQISIKEAYKVFESVLEIQGFTALEAGEVVKIVPLPDARTKNMETLLKDLPANPEDKLVTQLIPLQYASPEEIQRLFAPLISKSSVMLAYEPTNTLIVTDLYSNIQRMLKILEAIDIPGVGQELAVIPIKYSDADKLVNLLNTVFQELPNQQQGKRPGPGRTIRFVADQRTNTIVVLASETDIGRVRSLVEMIDKEVPKGKEKIHVYYLENAAAEDLVKVLQEVPSQKGGGAAANGAKEEASRAPSAAISSDVRITADKATNSLIIMAEMDDYQVLEEIIKKLDIPRSMVYLECLIMEVNVQSDFSVGTEWTALGKTDIGSKSGGVGAGYSGGSSWDQIGGLLTPGTSGVGLLPTGFSLGIFSELIEIGGVKFPGLAAVINAFRQSKDVHILSTPQVLTTDNEKATIVVGKNIPYQTKSGSSDVESYNTYEYKDVGIKLEITPMISKDRSVRLKIAQEVTKLDDTSTASSDLSRPTTLKRTIDTVVVVKDTSTVVIGGLIDDSISKSKNAIPCIGDVPLAGWLFKNESSSQDKTNLYIFMTPHVIQQPSEAKTIYEEKREEIESIKSGNVKLY